MSLDAYAEFLRTRAALDFYERKFPLVGFRPLSVQAQFIGCTAKVSWMSGGNRSGKTECGAFKAAALANGILGRFYPGFPADGRPVRGWISTLDYKLSKVVKRKMEKYLGATLRRWYEKDMMFSLHNGSEVFIKSEESGEQKYQAEDIGFCWKDEQGDHRAEGIVNEILRALTDSDGPLFGTLTPTMGTGWIGPRFYEPWVQATGDTPGVVANGTTFFYANTEDNPHLSRQGLKSFIAQQVTEEQKQVRLHGRFVTLEGLVYAMFREARHVIDPVPIPKEWKRYRGMDFGLDAPSTCLFAAVEPPTPKDQKCPCPPTHQPHSLPRLHLYNEVYDTRQGHTIGRTCAWIKQESGDQQFVRTVLDPSCWNENAAPEAIGGHFVVALEYERQGIYPEKADNDVESGVERIWTYLGAENEQAQLVIHRNCQNMIREIRGQRWKRNVGGLVITAVGTGMGDKIDKNCPDHLLDPLRYIVKCDPLGSTLAMRGPSVDPWPYEEYDPIDQEKVVYEDDGLGYYR